MKMKSALCGNDGKQLFMAPVAELQCQCNVRCFVVTTLCFRHNICYYLLNTTDIQTCEFLKNSQVHESLAHPTFIRLQECSADECVYRSP